MLAGCGPTPVPMAVPRPAMARRPVVLRVQVREGTAQVVREVPLEEYVAATALSEVHPDAADEAVAGRVFEVQAVLAGTYAMSNRWRHAKDGFDCGFTTTCQLYVTQRQ